ncbi:hypothetical protein NE865_12888 [Phthorimaea operculella]|nr:hypothetical protein NE865_12888 [Phthorimaea operculella]
MSVTGSPKFKSPIPAEHFLDVNTSTPSHYSSDPAIYNEGEHGDGHSQIANFVSHRNKRLRDDSAEPSELTLFKEEMRDMMSSFIKEQKVGLAVLASDLQEIKETNAKIEATMALLTVQNEQFHHKIQLLEEQVKKDREYIYILEDKIEDLQRTSRKTCLELKNVPKIAQESQSDLIKIVTNLANTIKLDMSERDIDDIFRLRARNNEETKPSIIVELRSSILRTDFLKKVKTFNISNNTRLQAKHLGFTKFEDTPIFISEQLTVKGSRLFFLARELKRTNKVKYCWTSHGKVLVRKDDTSKVIHIQNEAQVHQLCQET